MNALARGSNRAAILTVSSVPARAARQPVTSYTARCTSSTACLSARRLRRRSRRTSLYQAMRYRKYVGSLRQRLGYLPVSFNVDGDESIWIHAVSVGEVLTARALAAELQRALPAPAPLPLDDDDGRAAGGDAADLHGRRRRLLLPVRPRRSSSAARCGSCRPRLFVMMETEIWPNLLRACRARGRARRWWSTAGSRRARTRATGWSGRFFRRVLADIDRFCMQSEESARRLIDLGADPARVIVTGSLKFDSLAGAGRRRTDRARAPRAAVLPRARVAAGHRRRQHDEGRGADRAAGVRAHARAAPTAPLLIIAPRHPERFDEVERLARDEGFRTRAPQRAADRRRAARPTSSCSTRSASWRSSTRWRPSCSSAAASCRPAATTSSSRRCFGKPIVFGPHMQNFREIAATFLETRAAVQVQDERELEDDVARRCSRDPARRAGARARRAGDRRREPRRPRADARGHRGPAAARRPGEGSRVPSREVMTGVVLGLSRALSLEPA